MDRMEIVAASRFGFAETVERLKAAIEAAKWSMPFEMDVKKTVEGKGFSAEPTFIVGVCHARHASTALREDPRIAAMLPCRIAVYEKAGKTFVTTLDARLLGTMYDGPSMAATAAEVDAAMRAFVRAATEG
ncbi:MAG: DUF302 domain-containing protein [Fimbriimonadaceae bacterium]|nr:DUF302 domain-containing protein [Fimbriimonadaceae bacterium]